VKSTKDLAREVHDRLKATYGPAYWREQLPPLDELVSTILSQNTNDINRDRAFQSLKDRFPSWESVRDAPTEQIIDAIHSAGLANQKGPRIQSILRSISEERGELDLDFLRQLGPQKARNWLLKHKGVGPKTAAIVMLFSLDMPAFPVDTHIYRVSARLGLLDEKATAKRAHEVLADLFPTETYYDVHLNLIRHGREICHPRRPDCERCTLQGLCRYYQKTFVGKGPNADNE
jgi:endonuclease-3